MGDFLETFFDFTGGIVATGILGERRLLKAGEMQLAD